jgi:ribosomal protein S21
MSDTARIETDLKRRSDEKGLYGDRREAYVYGTLRKIEKATAAKDRREKFLAPLKANMANRPAGFGMFKGTVERIIRKPKKV